MCKTSMEKVLDVGCGSRKVLGSTGIDQFPLSGVDVVHELNSIPWPLESNSFDRIVFSHSISHLSDISATIIECHRLLKPGGFIEIVAPHYASDNFNTDPTHKVHLGARSMNYFVDNVDFGYRYIPDAFCFELLATHVSFREAQTSWRPALKFNPLALVGIEWIANRFIRIYERLFCWMLPPSEVYFLLRKYDPTSKDGALK